MRAGVSGGGPWDALCVMAKVGEAALERTIGRAEITAPKRLLKCAVPDNVWGH